MKLGTCGSRDSSAMVRGCCRSSCTHLPLVMAVADVVVVPAIDVLDVMVMRLFEGPFVYMLPVFCLSGHPCFCAAIC